MQVDTALLVLQDNRLNQGCQWVPYILMAEFGVLEIWVVICFPKIPLRIEDKARMGSRPPKP